MKYSRLSCRPVATHQDELKDLVILYRSAPNLNTLSLPEDVCTFVRERKLKTRLSIHVEASKLADDYIVAKKKVPPMPRKMTRRG